MVTRTLSLSLSLTLSVSISLRFSDQFPDESGLAVFIDAKDDGSDGDNWSYRSCKAPVKSSPPTNQHPVFYRPDALPVVRPQCHSTEGKISHPMDLLTPNSPGVFQLCLWPLIAPGYLGGGLPCLSSVLWCQYPFMVTYCLTVKSSFYNRYNCNMFIIQPYVLIKFFITITHSALIFTWYNTSYIQKLQHVVSDPTPGITKLLKTRLKNIVM